MTFDHLADFRYVWGKIAIASAADSAANMLKHRGQTWSMRKGINPGRPRPNFSRKISKENLKKQRCLAG